MPPNWEGIDCGDIFDKTFERAKKALMAFNIVEALSMQISHPKLVIVLPPVMSKTPSICRQVVGAILFCCQARLWLGGGILRFNKNSGSRTVTALPELSLKGLSVIYRDSYEDHCNLSSIF